MKDTTDEELIKSLWNILFNIEAYKKAKKEKRAISNIISLKVMEEKRDELLAEYDKRFPNRI